MDGPVEPVQDAVKNCVVEDQLIMPFVRVGNTVHKIMVMVHTPQKWSLTRLI